MDLYLNYKSPLLTDRSKINPTLHKTKIQNSKQVSIKHTWKEIKHHLQIT